MEDLFSKQQESPRAAQLKRELERRSNDTIRVRNITNEDFIVRWGGYAFIVPGKDRDRGQGKGEAVLPRYIATNYVKHMADKILQQELLDAVKNENKRRLESGMAAMNKWEEEYVFSQPFNINNVDLRRKVIQQLWLGIEEEYGMDLQPDDLSSHKRDPRSPDEQILAELERPVKKQYADMPAPIPSNDPILAQVPQTNSAIPEIEGHDGEPDEEDDSSLPDIQP